MTDSSEVWIDQEGSLWSDAEIEIVRYAVAFPDPDEPDCLIPRLSDTLNECREFMRHRPGGFLVKCVETITHTFSPWVLADAEQEDK